MIALARQVRSLPRPVQVLLLNQLTINVGFYMLMPYLAVHLAAELGHAAWVVGLVLGVRNLSQQGLFLVGGSLADRVGYKPMIMAGCALRTLGFGLFGLVDSVAGLLVASVLTGLAGALFNPAVRAYLATAAADRRLEAFAVFNVFCQLGILLGPLLGVALLGAGFRVVCLVSAALFAGLTVLQARTLPARGAATSSRGRPVLADWREVLTNRAFLLFAASMAGSYLLLFQLYLALPLEVRRLTGGDAGTSLLFAVSAVLAILLQVRVTAWCVRRWSPTRAMVRGLWLMTAAFLPLVVATHVGQGLAGDGATAAGWAPADAGALVPVLLTTVLLTLGTLVLYPFEMTTVVTVGGDRLTGTYYGAYQTMAGVGVAAGTLLSGVLFDAARHSGHATLPWLLFLLVGAASAAGLHALARTGAMPAAGAATALRSGA